MARKPKANITKAFILQLYGLKALTFRVKLLQQVAEHRSLNELREHLGLSEEFSLQAESSRKTSSGVRRIRLRQMFKGLPIRVATLQASQNENGFYTGAVSGFCPSIPSKFDISQSQSKSKLERALVKYINDNDKDIPGEKVKVDELQNLKYEKQIHIDDKGKPVVVYFVSALVERDVENGAYIRYPRVLFKAKGLKSITGILPVKKHQGHCKGRGKTTCPKARGGNRKVRGVFYGPGCDEVCINAAVKKGNKCVLENDMVNVKTLKNSWSRKNAEIVSFDCEDKLNDRSNGAFSPSADAFYYAQIFYDVLEDWGRLERTNSEPHTLYVHFGDNYPNSFWDGRSTTFGDGTGRTFPYAISEIIGHEMGHAVTESFGNLVFDRESESVNEAFSDFCGKAVTYYLNGEKAGWEFARALVKNRDDSLRYFDNPGRDGSTISNLKDFDSKTDAYTAMGIYLKAFYLIIAEQGVRFRDVFEAFVFANQIYWNEETTFIDGACGVLRAASDLGLNTNAFKAGFDGVGIQLSFCKLSGNEDHIISCHRNINGELRYAEVSSYRTAKYRVSSSDNNYVRVTITGAGDFTVTMQSHCASGYSVSSNERSAVFPLNGDSRISISADSEDLLNIKVRFEFENNSE